MHTGSLHYNDKYVNDSTIDGRKTFFFYQNEIEFFIFHYQFNATRIVDLSVLEKSQNIRIHNLILKIEERKI